MKRIIVLGIVVLFTIQLFSAEKVTDFKLENIEGKQVKLSDFQKEGLVIIDFWATWCVPCKKSLPKMNQIHEKFDNVNVLAICADKPRKKADAVAHIKSNKFKFITLFDTKKVVQKQFNVSNIPYSLIVDQDGTILYEHTGYKRGDEKHYEEIILKWQKKQNLKDNAEKKDGMTAEVKTLKTESMLSEKETEQPSSAIKELKQTDVEQPDTPQAGE